MIQFWEGKNKNLLQALPPRNWITLIEETLEITRQMGKKQGKNPLPLAAAYPWDSVISESGDPNRKVRVTKQ